MGSNPGDDDDDVVVVVAEAVLAAAAEDGDDGAVVAVVADDCGREGPVRTRRDNGRWRTDTPNYRSIHPRPS